MSELEDVRDKWQTYRMWLDEAEHERNRLIRQAHAEGLSLRKIAQEAGVSHQRVAQIINAEEKS